MLRPAQHDGLERGRSGLRIPRRSGCRLHPPSCCGRPQRHPDVSVRSGVSRPVVPRERQSDVSQVSPCRTRPGDRFLALSRLRRRCPPGELCEGLRWGSLGRARKRVPARRSPTRFLGMTGVSRFYLMPRRMVRRLACLDVLAAGLYEADSRHFWAFGVRYSIRSRFDRLWRAQRSWMFSATSEEPPLEYGMM